MSANNPSQRTFPCSACQKDIKIPYNLPATVAPCPHCGTSIQSPGPPAPNQQAQVQQPVAQQPQHPQQQAPQRAQQPVQHPQQQTQPTQPAAAVAPNVAPQNPSPQVTPAKASGGKNKLPFILIGLGLVGLIGAFGAYKLVKKKRYNDLVKQKTEENEALRQEAIKQGVPGAELSQDERQYLREGWRTESTSVLSKFLSATSAEEKAKYIIGGSEKVSLLKNFYDNPEFNDEDTAIDAFSHITLPYEDMKRGIFQMSYSRPKQYELGNLFAPIFPLAVRYGIEQPGLLYSVVDGEKFYSEPLNIAVFFKKEKDGLKLDWDTYTQTKYRLLRKFRENPNPGQKAIFRVLVTEGITPATGETKGPGQHVYTVSDYIHGDTIRVISNDNTPEGEILSAVNWVGQKNFTGRTATVELTWVQQGDQPVIKITEVLCWEFLNIGGTLGNTDNYQDPTAVEATEAPAEPAAQ